MLNKKETYKNLIKGLEQDIQNLTTQINQQVGLMNNLTLMLELVNREMENVLKEFPDEDTVSKPEESIQ